MGQRTEITRDKAKQLLEEAVKAGYEIHMNCPDGPWEYKDGVLTQYDVYDCYNEEYSDEHEPLAMCRYFYIEDGYLCMCYRKPTPKYPNTRTMKLRFLKRIDITI